MSSASRKLFYRTLHLHSINTQTNPHIILKHTIKSITTISISNFNLKSSNLHQKQTSTNLFSTKNYYDDFDSDSDLSDSDTEDNIKPQNKSRGKQTELMMNRLIISNLDYNTSQTDIWKLCQNYGRVIDVHLPSNKNSDLYNRGFGFVTFDNDKHAQIALDKISGIMFNSRELKIDFAMKPTHKTLRKTYYKGNSSEVVLSNTVSNRMDNNRNIVTNNVKELNETTVTINGLPGNVNMEQITKMFDEFGDVVNVIFSPYEMFGNTFMNAIVSVKLKQNNDGDNMDNMNKIE
eukprot:225472_1